MHERIDDLSSTLVLPHKIGIAIGIEVDRKRTQLIYVRRHRKEERTVQKRDYQRDLAAASSVEDACSSLRSDLEDQPIARFNVRSVASTIEVAIRPQSQGGCDSTGNPRPYGIVVAGRYFEDFSKIGRPIDGPIFAHHQSLRIILIGREGMQQGKRAIWRDLEQGPEPGCPSIKSDPYGVAIRSLHHTSLRRSAIGIQVVVQRGEGM